MSKRNPTPEICPASEHDWSEASRLYSEQKTKRHKCMRCGAWGWRKLNSRKIVAYPDQELLPEPTWGERGADFNLRRHYDAGFSGRVRRPSLEDYDAVYRSEA